MISGAANDIPQIAAYGEQLVTVSASIGLLEGLQFLNKIMAKSEPELGYTISARLDTGLPLIGIIPVADSGQLSLSDFQR